MGSLCIHSIWAFLLLTLEFHAKPGAETTGIMFLCAGFVFLYLANNKKQYYEKVVRHFRYAINSSNIEVTYSDEVNIPNEEPEKVRIQDIDIIYLKYKSKEIAEIKLIMKDGIEQKIPGLINTPEFLDEIKAVIGKDITRVYR